MRAAVYYGRRDLRLTTIPEPEPGPAEVKVRVLYNGICGSDLLEYYDGPVTTRTDTPHPLTGVTNPVVMGHELCGEVVALGEGSEGLAIGDLVAVEPVETCGKCLHCGAGQYNHCPHLAIYGYNRGGGLAEYTVVKRRMAHRLPPDVSALQGALIEPLAIAWHTVNRCAVSAGEVVAIHGAGPIGAGAFLTLRRRGVEAIVVDPSAARRAALARLGARHVLDPHQCDVVSAIRDLTGGHGAHASIDAAGGPRAFAAMLHGTRVDGTAVVVAIHHEPVVVPPFDLLMPEVKLTGVALSVNAFPAVIEEMARGSYPLQGWVETIPFDGVIEQGIERLRRQEGMKIVVNVAGGRA
jgi:(R,R)-butanediol dehydrogenase / meso-butanediol dehydrogenase / diacetyl reductase